MILTAMQAIAGSRWLWCQGYLSLERVVELWSLLSAIHSEVKLYQLLVMGVAQVFADAVRCLTSQLKSLMFAALC